MVEDNTEENIFFDENRTNDVFIIKSVFKKMIG
jgi:hypothetical protein